MEVMASSEFFNKVSRETSSFSFSQIYGYTNKFHKVRCQYDVIRMLLTSHKNNQQCNQIKKILIRYYCYYILTLEVYKYVTQREKEKNKKANFIQKFYAHRHYIAYRTDGSGIFRKCTSKE